MKSTQTDSTHGDSMAAHVFDRLSAGVTNVDILPDPPNYKQAMKQPDARKWTEGIELELQQLARLNVFSEPVMFLEGVQLIEIDRYEARLVAQGFLQTFGLDFFDTCAPVAHLIFFRVIYALYVLLQFIVDSMDVDVAFLNASLQDDVYNKTPPK